MDLNKLAIECFKGKSLWRTLCNIKISEFKVYGKLLDAGSKSLSSSYYRYLDLSGVKSTTFVDYYYSDNSNILKIDLEEKLPIDDCSFDSILLMNVLEHVFNHKSLLNELYRITQIKGILIGTVPFMFRYHADPNDFYRFTHTCLKRNLIDSGFKSVKIYTIGNGLLLSLADQISRFIPNKKLFFPLIFLIWIVALFLSRFKFFRKEDIEINNKQASYLGMLFVARKF